MSMTFFFSKVRERPATRQHPCANNNGYGFQNEQIANRCFFSVINRHNVCEQKKKKLFGEWKTWPTWFDEFFLREIGRKKKRKKLFRWESPLVPTTQFGTKNTISLLDSTKNLNELRKNKTIEKKKKEKYKHPVTVQDEKVYKLEDEQKTADCVQQQHWTQEILTTRQCEWVIGLLHCAAIHIHCLHHEN